MTQLIDTSLRDGHQSLLATRMSTEQCMRVLPMLVDAGYSILELWGGATLDAALRFTNDDPFERLERFTEEIDKAGRPIEIRSLCRGQNLFGYSPYPDNVVTHFLREAVRTATTSNVTHRMRIFDALNDHRNLITAIMATKTFDGHAEAAISYTTSPVHDTAHFVRFAERAMEWGASSLAIKDMAGLLHPAEAWVLIKALRAKFPDTFITLHSHDTNGLAVASYVVAMMAGIDALDTGYGPMAGATAQPPAELMRFFAAELGIELGVDFSNAAQIDTELRQIRKELAAVDKAPDHFGGPWPSEPTDDMKRAIGKVIELLSTEDHDKCTEACDVIERELMVPMGYPAIDKSQLESQIPGGMLSNLYNQLKDQDKLDLMPQVQEEIPRVRKAAGYVPLVTPSSQIVGTQATFNVMQGKPYAFVSEPFRDMVMGKYGQPPGPVDPEMLAAVAQGQQPFTGRPADEVPDTDLQAIYREHGELIKNERDLLLMVLFPAPAEKFFKARAGS
ncbi:MAG: oxaloacetate decarboxylase subunit alpha [Planctomycetota bacterium]